MAVQALTGLNSSGSWLPTLLAMSQMTNQISVTISSDGRCSWLSDHFTSSPVGRPEEDDVAARVERHVPAMVSAGITPNRSMVLYLSDPYARLGRTSASTQIDDSGALCHPAR